MTLKQEIGWLLLLGSTGHCFLLAGVMVARYKHRTILKILVAITGASGALYAQRLLDNLDTSQHEVHVVLSNYARQVIAEELPDGLHLSSGVKTHNVKSMNAPFASGSNPPDAMVVIPCTMGTMGRIAQRKEKIDFGTARNPVESRSREEHGTVAASRSSYFAGQSEFLRQSKNHPGSSGHGCGARAGPSRCAKPARTSLGRGTRVICTNTEHRTPNNERRKKLLGKFGLCTMVTTMAANLIWKIACWSLHRQ